MQILDAPVPQMEASIPAVLEHVIVPHLPEIQVVERVARVRAPLPVLSRQPDFVTPLTLQLISRKRRRTTTRWRRKKSWRCSTHGEQELHPSTLRAVDAPVPQTTVELMKEIAEQLVEVPMPQILGYRSSCRKKIVEVTQFMPHERIADVFPVPQFRNKLWESRSFFRRSGSAASWSRSWCASATDYAENVDVIQLVRTTVGQIVAFPLPQIHGKIVQVFSSS